MKSQISVYCYFDPAYGWDARAAISALEPRGCRIVQGKDPSEILLLLQVGRPAAVVYTLADDDAAESADYMMTKRRAFDRRVPIVLVGPGQPRDGLQLLYPGEDEYAPRHLPLHALADTVMELGEHPPWEAESAPPAPILKLDDPAIEPAMGAPSGEGEVLIASEAPEKASPSRGDLDMGAIPASAVFGDDTFAGKLSEAIEGEPAEPAPRSWLKIAAIIAGAAVAIAIGVAFYLSFGAAGPPPVAVSRGPVEGLPAPARPAPPERVGDVGPAPSPEAPGDIETAPERPPARRSGTGPSSGGGLPEGVEVPFPAHFRAELALFWFEEEWEETRFLEMIRTLDPSRRVRLVGHPTTDEVDGGKRSLGLSRAWAVEKYLVRNGVDPEMIDTEQGRPVAADVDRDDRGRPRNRWVGVVVE